MAFADGNTDTVSLTDEEFSVRLEALGPFESAPRLAIAVSGGADSMALALLSHAWAQRRSGTVVALTVDHRLRPESAAEVRQVSEWLTARGIAHATLVWEGPHPQSDIQAEARSARYRLLEAWCGEHGYLHLLTAHHREDRAETFWLRLARGSGIDGLAGIPAGSERAACRLLRPLLDVPSDRLRARLREAHQDWIEDPSNRNRAFARVRLREARGLLADEGLSPQRLENTMRHLGRARQALEASAAAVLAQAVELHPSGFAWLESEVIRRSEPELALRALAAVLMTIGGADYPPRVERLEGLYEALVRQDLARGRTLGGCRLVPQGHRVMVCRESAEIEPPVALLPGRICLWDRRFRVTTGTACPPGTAVGALDRDRLSLSAEARERLQWLPGPVRPGLAALRDEAGVVAVPALGWRRADAHWLRDVQITFRPSRPLAFARFTVV